MGNGIYFRSCNAALSLNCKYVQHVKIYLPSNYEVNLIAHLGVIALFHHFLKFLILILFVLYFKNKFDEKRVITPRWVIRMAG
jgi:hypothetical protein